MENILSSKARVKKIIISELQEVTKKYGMPRRTEIIYSTDIEEEEIVEEIPDYPVNLFFTKEGYFKKITPLSLRMGGEQKLKEGDSILTSVESSNAVELLFWTNQYQVYKSRASEFDDTKASVLGDYVASKLSMDPEETARFMSVISEYKGYMIFVFENGKVAKVDISCYETKNNRKKLIKAFSDASELVNAIYIKEDCEIVIKSSSGRYLLLNTGAIAPKTTKNTLGVRVMTLKKGHRVVSAELYTENRFAKPSRYRTKSLPAAGATLSGEDEGEQMTL